MGAAKEFLQKLAIERETNRIIKNTDSAMKELRGSHIAEMKGGDVLIIPNHSGQHDAGTTKTPVNDLDIANKKYVDDNIGGAHTASSTDSLTNKTIDDFSNKVDADEVHIRVRNESGGPMAKGALVYISGYSIGEDKPLVSLADADGANTFPVLAMVNDGTIANNATGHGTVSGRVSGIDTNSFNVGDTIYMSTTAGEFSTRPTGAGEEVQAIGIILRKHASLGVVEVFGAGRINQSPNAGHNDFTDFVANEHLDWTADLGATNIHAGNYTDTTYTSGDFTHDDLIAGTIADHDTTATGAELNTLTGGGDTTLHDHDGISENTTHRGSAGGTDHSDVSTNNSKVSFTKTNVKGHIEHGGTAGTGRPSGFTSVEWIGTVEPSNAVNGDTWIDTS